MQDTDQQEVQWDTETDPRESQRGRLEIENEEFVRAHGSHFQGVWFVSDRIFDEGHQLASHMGGLHRVILGMQEVQPQRFATQGIPRSRGDVVLTPNLTKSRANLWQIISSYSKVSEIDTAHIVGTGTERASTQITEDIINEPPLYLDNRSPKQVQCHLAEELQLLLSLMLQRSIPEAIKHSHNYYYQEISQLCNQFLNLESHILQPENDHFKITILGQPRIGKSSIWKLLNLSISEIQAKGSPLPYISGKVTDLYASSAPQDIAGLYDEISDLDILKLRQSRARYNRPGYPQLSPAYVANKIGGIYGISTPTNPGPPRETRHPALWLVDTGGLPTFKLTEEQLDLLAQDDDFFYNNLDLLYDLPSLVAMNSSDLILYLESDRPDLDDRLLTLANIFCPGKVAMLRNPFLHRPELLKPSFIRDLRNRGLLMDQPLINDLIAQFLEETLQGIESKYSPTGSLATHLENLVLHIRDYHFRQGYPEVFEALGLTDDTVKAMCNIKPPKMTSDWALADDLVRLAEAAF